MGPGCPGRRRTRVRCHAETVLGAPAPVRVLGIDETRRGKPRWTRDTDSGRWVRTDPWDTGFRRSGRRSGACSDKSRDAPAQRSVNG